MARSYFVQEMLARTKAVNVKFGCLVPEGTKYPVRSSEKIGEANPDETGAH